MWFDWEVTVWGLEKISLADALYFLSHLALLLKRSYMLDNRVGVDNIEFFVLKLLHISGVTNHTGEVGIGDLVATDVKHRNLHLFIRKFHLFPELDSSTYVEDTQWPGQWCD